MIFRPITREDTAAVTEYALRALRSVSTDQPLHVAPMKVRDAVAFFAKDASGQHFNLAAFDDKLCVGAIAAFSAEMAFYERQEAHVMFAMADVPGVGMRLIRDMLSWAKGEPRIRRIVWSMNAGAMGERMTRVLGKRLGFHNVNLLCWNKG